MLLKWQPISGVSSSDDCVSCRHTEWKAYEHGRTRSRVCVCEQKETEIFCSTLDIQQISHSCMCVYQAFSVSFKLAFSLFSILQGIWVAEQSSQWMCTTAWWNGLHVRLQDWPCLCWRTYSTDLRRHQWDHDGSCFPHCFSKLKLAWMLKFHVCHLCRALWLIECSNTHTLEYSSACVLEYTCTFCPWSLSSSLTHTLTHVCWRIIMWTYGLIFQYHDSQCWLWWSILTPTYIKCPLSLPPPPPPQHPIPPWHSHFSYLPSAALEISWCVYYKNTSSSTTCTSYDLFSAISVEGHGTCTAEADSF